MEHDTLEESVTTKAHGVEAFEVGLGAPLEALAKTIEKLGRLKKLGEQKSLINLLDLRKQLEDARRLAREVNGMVDEIDQRFDGYRLCVSEADQIEWTLRFRQAFHSGFPPVEGEFPVFQVFPVEVKVEFDNELVRINNRIQRNLHPGAVAAQVEKEWERLNRERFNEGSFAKKLLRAYDLVIAKQQIDSQGSNSGRTAMLKDVHGVLALRQGMSGYSLNQFAFDLYRLRKSDQMVQDGRHLLLGTARNRGGLVITHPDGRQEMLSSMEVNEDKSS